MYQRLKGAIDSRIAEEQARQRQAQVSAASSQSTKATPGRNTRQVNNRNGSIPIRTSSPRQRETPRVAPDPAEFEHEFAIGGDDSSAVPSRVATPLPPQVKEENPADGVEGRENGDGNEVEKVKEEEKEEEEADEQKSVNTPTSRSSDLPTEVRVKLRKLDRLEGKYQELLRAYKTAHARVQLIEPFEASLREHTPLTTISDPGALVEYFTQNNLKSGMVLDELRRVSADRDEYKKKFDESEKSAAQLREEISILKTEKETAVPQVTDDGRPSLEVKTDEKTSSSSPSLVRSPTTASTASRVPSFSLFSPKAKIKSPQLPPPPPPKEGAEEFFSYDSELPRLESELHERQAEVEELKKQVQTLKGDLVVARDSTESMVQSLETATRELNDLRDAKDKYNDERKEMQKKIDELQTSADRADEQCNQLERQINHLQAEKEEVDKARQEAQSRADDLAVQHSDTQGSLAEQSRLVDTLNERLGQKDAMVKDLEDTLATYKSAERQDSQYAETEVSTEKRISTMQNIMETLRTQLKSAEDTIAELNLDLASRQEEFANRPSTRVFGFMDDNNPFYETIESREDAVHFLAQKFELVPNTSVSREAERLTATLVEDTSVSGTGKKKNKKKRKGKGVAQNDAVEHDLPVKVTEDLAEAEDEATAAGPVSDGAIMAALEKEITSLRFEIEAKSDTIEKLNTQLREHAALQEEIETLRDDLLHQGEEHVEARDQLKQASEQKDAMAASVEKLEHELTQLRQHVSRFADREKAHQDLTAQYEELRNKASGMQTDLAAAEALASARFKDITDLKDVLGKAQPELKVLRVENRDLKSVRDDLRNKSGELNRLESRHEDLKGEIKGMAKRLGDKDVEIRELSHKLEQERGAKSKSEEEARVARSDHRYAETRRMELVEEKEGLSKDLARARDEANELRVRLRDLEDQVQGHTRQVSELRDDINLKTALHSTSQSLVQSLRDQTHELSVQAREAGQRADGLEEELGEAQRLLAERTREAGTMRMLLAQAETGTEARMRELRERMEAAVEERERVEDESGVAGRRWIRDVEEARTRLRDVQKVVRGLEEEKEEWDRRFKESRKRREELEGVNEKVTAEVGEIREMVRGLREALDLAEGQVRDLETQRVGSRREIDDARDKVEKLTRSNKALSEEVKSLQQSNMPRKTKTGGGLDSAVPSSRSSLDSTSLGAGLGGRAKSPAPSTVSTRTNMAAGARGPGQTSSSSPSTGQAGAAPMDYVYLKNVLLQFLEQRDKTHQKQLIPVLGMLLRFDRQDEQKWAAAIAAR